MDNYPIYDTIAWIWEVQRKMAEDIKDITPKEKADYYSEMASGVLEEITATREYEKI